MSQDGYIKRMAPGTFKAQKRGGKGLIGSELKDEDLVNQIITADTHDNILFFTTRGRVFQTKRTKFGCGAHREGKVNS